MLTGATDPPERLGKTLAGQTSQARILYHVYDAKSDQCEVERGRQQRARHHSLPGGK